MWKYLNLVPLSALINLSFNNGIFPGFPKLARVMPIFKTGDELDCNNYRLISVWSNISKLIEKLLYNKLYNFLNQNKCLFNYQFGIRDHHSMNHTFLNIKEKKIQYALDDGTYVCGIFLDLQKFFSKNHLSFFETSW